MMKKTYASIGAGVILIVLLAAAFLFLTGGKIKLSQVSRFGNAVKEIKINGNIFSAEVAATSEKRALGLSGRRELCSNCAMLFVFEKPGNASFWMKDMLFDLDIVWIAGDEIVDIDKNVSYKRGTEETIRPLIPIDKVLEIGAGESDRLNLKVGDRVDFGFKSSAFLNLQSQVL